MVVILLWMNLSSSSLFFLFSLVNSVFFFFFSAIFVTLFDFVSVCVCFVFVCIITTFYITFIQTNSTCDGRWQTWRLCMRISYVYFNFNYFVFVLRFCCFEFIYLFSFVDYDVVVVFLSSVCTLFFCAPHARTHTQCGGDCLR